MNEKTTPAEPATPENPQTPAAPSASSLKKLAAVAYGEASPDDNPDEIAGIAWAVSNRARAWNNKSIDKILAVPGYSYVITDGNERYRKFMKATDEQIAADKGMSIAMEAAKNAWENKGSDPSNGAFWWDGEDFLEKGERQYRRKSRFRYGDPSHNIFNVPENVHTPPIVTYFWRENKKTGEKVKIKERGRYDHLFESTAAHGKTIFWKTSPDYVKASGAKDYK